MKKIVSHMKDETRGLKVVEGESNNIRPKEIKVRVVSALLTTGDVARLNFASKNVGQFYSGEIVEVGHKVKKYGVGQRICGVSKGVYAEYINVHQDSMFALVPKHIGLKDAVALLFGGSTSLYFLKKVVDGSSKARICINGATGEVGVNAVQIMKAYGHQVTAIASERNFDFLVTLGCDLLLDYRKDHLTDYMKEYDIFFDAVGKMALSSIKYLPDGSSFLTTQLSFNVLKHKLISFFKKVKLVIGIAKVSKKDIDELFNLYDVGSLKAIIDSEYTFDTINMALSRVKSGRKVGAVVINISKEAI